MTDLGQIVAQTPKSRFSFKIILMVLKQRVVDRLK